ncbi:MAG: NTP transferase domain-containing protein [Caulobacteraceae bacterium]
MGTKVPASQHLEALVLAAGRGARFGGGKLLATYRDGLVIEGAVAAAFAAPVSRVTLTVGCDGSAVAAAAQAYAERTGQSERLQVVEAADWADGMAASLKRGIAALAPETRGVFVFLGDMPRIPATISQGLAEALECGAAAAIPTFQGRRGHPVLLGVELFSAIASLSGDQGARPIIEGLGARLVEVEADDDGVLFDIDAPQDLTRGR